MRLPLSPSHQERRLKSRESSTSAEGLQSPIVKFLTKEGGAEGAIALDIVQRVGAENGDLIFFGADKTSIVNDAIGALRIKVGHDLNMLTGSFA